MATTNDPASTRIEVIPATRDQESILANLLQLYCHDFSEFHEISLGADGRFGYAHLPSYFTDPGRYPLLVRIDGKPGGFILVKRGSEFTGNPDVWDVAEFFVVRGCRRRGVGTAVARHAWTLLPGSWEVRVLERNHAAVAFWQHAIAQFTGHTTTPTRVEKGDKVWLLFCFEAGSSS